MALFNFNLAFYLLDERRDLILPRTNPDLVPAKDFIDDWRIRYFALVPRHGCFQLGRTVPLHRFNPDCRDAGEAFFSTQKQINTGAHVYKNAAIAVTTAGGENRVTWCDTCFPASPSGEHITFEYIEQVTGLSCAQLHELCEAITGEPFLEGLA